MLVFSGKSFAGRWVDDSNQKLLGEKNQKLLGEKNQKLPGEKNQKLPGEKEGAAGRRVGRRKALPLEPPRGPSSPLETGRGGPHLTNEAPKILSDR